MRRGPCNKLIRSIVHVKYIGTWFCFFSFSLFFSLFFLPVWEICSRQKKKMASHPHKSHHHHQRLLFLKRLAIILLLHTTTAAAAAASLNPNPNLDLNINLPPTSPAAALNTSSHEYHCNNLPTWAGGRPNSPAYYEPGDCKRAIRMFEQDVVRKPGKAQWLSVGFPHAMPGYGPAVWTPRRYIYGECSDSLVFVSFLFLHFLLFCYCCGSGYKTCSILST